MNARTPLRAGDRVYFGDRAKLHAGVVHEVISDHTVLVEFDDGMMHYLPPHWLDREPDE